MFRDLTCEACAQGAKPGGVMSAQQAVLDFWLEEVGSEGWYSAVDAVDAKIVRQFGGLFEQILAGGLADWGQTAQGALAYLIVADQFSRNMFRGDRKAFAADPAALEMAGHAIAQDLDLQIPEPERVFFYMPYEHSEDLANQDRSVELMQTRLPLTGKGFAFHAAVHREVIHRYGRFPFRNAALGRVSTPAEDAFLAAGGYGGLVREMQA